MGFETVMLLNTTAIVVNCTILVLAGNSMMNAMKDMSENVNRY